MSSTLVSCPICSRQFRTDVIEDHANKCIFLNTLPSQSTKRDGYHLEIKHSEEKRLKTETMQLNNSVIKSPKSSSLVGENKNVPLSERMRPLKLEDLVGQEKAFGPGSMLRSMLEQAKIPNMILWGPPGCGKTSLANVVANICREHDHMRFVKLSATMVGINDVKEIVKVAKNEAQFKRQTVLFMDEIHRFNKLQQDTFLPHVENGTITLIGATTENPSFSLNNALISRCRVVIMEKLSVDDIQQILEKALNRKKQVQIIDKDKQREATNGDNLPRYLIQKESLIWLAEVSDGDARVALGALELVLSARDPGSEFHKSGPALITLENLKEGIKRSAIVYDRAGEEHFNTISAVHKAVRASDDNAALYWTTRALAAGEDPLYVARRLVRIACEDIGLADPSALVEAVACLQGCQHIGMPECDVLLVQCAVRLARAPKSREVYAAMKNCQKSLAEAKGPLPTVPLHLRNATTKLMKQLGYSDGYNLLHKDHSGLTYMPQGMEDVNYFSNLEENGIDC